MDRVPYRRVTPPRNGAASQHFGKPRLEHKPDHDDEKISFGENMIVQFIISGILMAAVLLICLVDIGPMMSLRSGLRQVFAGATTVEAFSAEVRHFGREWLNLEPEPATELLDLPIFSIPEFSPIDSQDNPPAVYEEFFNPQPAPTAYEQYPNPQIPGLLVSPGLWD